jgi:hypothetical protein
MLKYWVQLGVRSIADPRGVLGELRARNYAITDVAMAAALVAALGVIFFEASLLLAPVEGEAGTLLGITSPIGAFVFQYAMILVTAAVVCYGGRMFGGQAGLDDSLLAVTWLQFVMLLVQILQVVALILVPPLGLLIFMVALILLVYLLVNFIMEIHGFKNPMAVVAGVIGAFFTIALVLSILLAILGFGLGGGVENV